MIKFTNKITSSEDFVDIHNIFLDGISDNVASIVQKVKDGAINTIYLKGILRY